MLSILHGPVYSKVGTLGLAAALRSQTLEPQKAAVSRSWTNDKDKVTSTLTLHLTPTRVASTPRIQGKV